MIEKLQHYTFSPKLFQLLFITQSIFNITSEATMKIEKLTREHV